MKLIAEFGCNFNNREQALLMMEQAKALGINMIKFQLFEKESVPEEIKEMSIDEELAKELFETGKQYEQEVFFTCFYPEAVDICERIGVRYYKVRYFDRNNLPLYRKLKHTTGLIFVSCQDPHDTIFYNMARYKKRVKFLFCVPKYPANIQDYENHMRLFFQDNPEKGLFPDKTTFSGISDHTNNLGLLQAFKNEEVYFEMHMKMDDNCIEKDWSKSFEELKEVLNHG